MPRTRRVNDVVFIYTLSDPRDSRVRYIGATQWPYEREQEHQRGHEPCTGDWVKELTLLSLTPLFRIVEGVPRNKDWTTVEEDWIRNGRAEGWDLLNVSSGITGTGVQQSELTRLRRAVSLTGNRNQAKLTVQEVRDIRLAYRTTAITQQELAKRYGVSLSAINLIVNYKVWKEVE